MSYASDFAGDYPTSDYPLLLHFYYTYAPYKQAVEALRNAGAVVLANGSATTNQKTQALMVMQRVLTYAAQTMPAFCGDSAILASGASPGDTDMLTAATWILPNLKSL